VFHASSITTSADSDVNQGAKRAAYNTTRAWQVDNTTHSNPVMVVSMLINDQQLHTLFPLVTVCLIGKATLIVT